MSYGYGYSTAFDWKAEDLHADATAQVTKAQIGPPLSALNVEPTPGAMISGAVNNIAAHYRAAYWLATASRLAAGQGKPSTGLTAAATVQVNAARTLNAWSWTPLRWLTDPATQDDEVQRTLEQSAGQVEAHGFPEIGKILRESATKRAIIQQRKELGVKKEAVGFFDQWWVKPAGYGLGAILLLGMIAWALKPYFGLASAAAGRGRRRRRR